MLRLFSADRSISSLKYAPEVVQPSYFGCFLHRNASDKILYLPEAVRLTVFVARSINEKGSSSFDSAGLLPYRISSFFALRTNIWPLLHINVEN